MQVKELIALLSKMNPEAEVVLANPADVDTQFVRGVEAVTVQVFKPYDESDDGFAEPEEVCHILPTGENVAEAEYEP